MSETAAHDHEFEVLEDDQTVPPRPEELIADASSRSDASPRPDDSAAPGPAGRPVSPGEASGPTT